MKTESASLDESNFKKICLYKLNLNGGEMNLFLYNSKKRERERVAYLLHNDRDISWETESANDFVKSQKKILAVD